MGNDAGSRGPLGGVVGEDGQYASKRAHLERRREWRQKLKELGLSRDQAEIWSTGAVRFRMKVRQLEGEKP